MDDINFGPLKFGNLKVKNRIFRSSISGRWYNYDGSGNQARINWEEKFARGGVGAIITSFVPVSIRQQIMPNYATSTLMRAFLFGAKSVKKYTYMTVNSSCN